MVFVTPGLGGGPGPCAAPIIASLASELGSLVVAVVTTPFMFEGPRRRRNAEGGLKELKGSVDTVITIANDKLLETVPDKTPFTEAFRFADDVLRQAVQGISDLINVPGIINLDFADVKTIMEGMGVALMGSGTASGENRAVEAAQAAISSPLLEETSINGARGVLLNIVGGPDMTMNEINEAAMLIHGSCDPDAEIIFGAVTNEGMSGNVTVTVIATGFSTPSREMAEETFGSNVAFIDKHRESKRLEDDPPVRHETEARTPLHKRETSSQRTKTGDPYPLAQKDPSRTGDHPHQTARRAQATRREEAKRGAARQAARAGHGETTPRRDTADMVTPRETPQEVLMAPQSFGANNMGGFEDENDLDIPTYLRNLRKRKAQG
jgi:cell division protein FtsZ